MAEAIRWSGLGLPNNFNFFQQSVQVRRLFYGDPHWYLRKRSRLWSLYEKKQDLHHSALDRYRLRSYQEISTPFKSANLEETTARVANLRPHFFYTQLSLVRKALAYYIHLPWTTFVCLHARHPFISGVANKNRERGEVVAGWAILLLLRVFFRAHALFNRLFVQVRATFSNFLVLAFAGACVCWGFNLDVQCRGMIWDVSCSDNRWGFIAGFTREICSF